MESLVSACGKRLKWLCQRRPRIQITHTQTIISLNFFHVSVYFLSKDYLLLALRFSFCSLFPTPFSIVIWIKDSVFWRFGRFLLVLSFSFFFFFPPVVINVCCLWHHLLQTQMKASTSLSAYWMKRASCRTVNLKCLLICIVIRPDGKKTSRSFFFFWVFEEC